MSSPQHQEAPGESPGTEAMRRVLFPTVPERSPNHPQHTRLRSPKDAPEPSPLKYSHSGLFEGDHVRANRRYTQEDLGDQVLTIMSVDSPAGEATVRDIHSQRQHTVKMIALKRCRSPSAQLADEMSRPRTRRIIPPNIETCLDRPYVQQEILWARKYNKKIITLYEAGDDHPGRFDFAKARQKYHGTEWASVLEIDAIKFQRESFCQDAMIQNILARCTGPTMAEAATLPQINLPGWWEFFLSHHQALGGDQMSNLWQLLRGKGKAAWYDNQMLDKSTAAMEEGVKHSEYFILFLTSKEEN